MKKPTNAIDREIESSLSTGTRKRLLLHVCCGPCAAGVLPRVTPHFDVTLYFCNSNILPKDEFIRRLDALKLLLTHFTDVKLIVAEYNPQHFLQIVQGLESLPEGGARCAECFGMRLGETAEYLAAHGDEYDFFATTLTVSPHKDATAVNAAGELAAENFGVKYLSSDFKKHDGYLTSIRLCKQYGIYRQTYCGCGFPSAARHDGDVSPPATQPRT